jgi:hypothetical protein
MKISSFDQIIIRGSFEKKNVDYLSFSLYYIQLLVEKI